MSSCERRLDSVICCWQQPLSFICFLQMMMPRKHDEQFDVVLLSCCFFFFRSWSRRYDHQQKWWSALALAKRGACRPRPIWWVLRDHSIKHSLGHYSALLAVQGLLTKATNHGGLDKSCHPTTITQSENDSTTSTRLHKSNACSLNGPLRRRCVRSRPAFSSSPRMVEKSADKWPVSSQAWQASTFQRSRWHHFILWWIDPDGSDLHQCQFGHAADISKKYRAAARPTTNQT